VRARQLPNLLLLPVLRKADAALLQLQFQTWVLQDCYASCVISSSSDHSFNMTAIMVSKKAQFGLVIFSVPSKKKVARSTFVLARFHFRATPIPACGT
jgi:hypothetical protein